MENSNDPIGNRTGDLPACSAVPQPNVSPRAAAIFNNKIIQTPVFFDHQALKITYYVSCRCQCANFHEWNVMGEGNNMFVSDDYLEWSGNSHCQPADISKYTRGSTSCAPRSRNYISCVPRCPLHVYQLSPDLSTPNMTRCVPRLVMNCISCIERYGCTKYPTIERFLQFYCALLCTQLYANIQNCWMISTTQLLYHVTV